MVNCAVLGCTNRSERGVRMYGFPANKERRAKWLAQVRRRNFTITRDANNKKICQAHFEEDQFALTKRGKTKLRADAIPTIFAYRPRVKRRKPPTVRCPPEPIAPIIIVKYITADHSYSRTESNIKDGRRRRDIKAEPSTTPPPPPTCTAPAPPPTCTATAPQPTCTAPAPPPTCTATAPQPTCTAPPPTCTAPTPQPTCTAPPPTPTFTAPPSTSSGPPPPTIIIVKPSASSSSVTSPRGPGSTAETPHTAAPAAPTRTMSEKLLIIDTDCGIDDAQAIMMALAAPDVHVLGITCVFGNAAVDDVCQNVLRVLTVCEQQGIPVFRGSGRALVGGSDSSREHFGSDGLGDVIKDRDPRWEEKIQREHAVNAMIRLVSEQQNQVSLVALGPLTNLALAVRLDPCFPQKLKDLFIMGGNMEGKGNLTIGAEFNFVMDPEAAYVVLEEFLCPTYIATWEYSCRNALTWEFFEELMDQEAPAARFMKTITSQCCAYNKEFMKNRRDVHFGPGFVSYDAYAMAACVDGSVVTESVRCPVRVELLGSMSRGMMMLDRTGQLKKEHSVCVFSKCDAEKFGRMLMESLRQPSRKQ